MQSPHHHVKIGTQTIIQNNDGQLLLIRREDFRIWVIPGGSLDYGETLEEGAIREAKEETGLDVELTGLVGIFNNGFDQSLIFTYAARPIGGTPTTSFESIEVDFFAPDDLPSSVPSVHEERIERFLQGQRGVFAEQYMPLKTRLVIPPLIKLRNLRNRYILKRPTPQQAQYAMCWQAIVDDRLVAEVMASRRELGWKTLEKAVSRKFGPAMPQSILDTRTDTTQHQLTIRMAFRKT